MSQSRQNATTTAIFVCARFVSGMRSGPVETGRSVARRDFRFKRPELRGPMENNNSYLTSLDLAGELVEPFAKPCDFGLTPLLDNFFSGALSALARPSASLGLNRASFFRRQGSELKPRISYAALNRRRFACFQMFDRDAELAGDSSQGLHRWRSQPASIREMYA